MLEVRIKRLIFGLIGLAIIILIVLLIFGFIILLLPIAIILVVIGLILGVLRKATRVKTSSTTTNKSAKSSKHEAIDVEYKVKEEK
ncbi:hypothetical protein HZC30_04625 [Candidatus Woesearchaeota archaeon]|nr:hypothetical protein [Candidatus Woesearchaeota archaeon]